MKIIESTPKAAVLNELGRRLAEYRKQQGLNQDELATSAGIGVATLRRIEDGRDAQIGSWIKLLLALGEAEALEGLLPENLNSPMAAIKKQRKAPTSVNEPRIVWGDEQ